MKATPESLRKRCDTALQSLPDAPYRTMLAALFGDLLAEVERLAAQSAPTGLTEMGWIIDAATKGELAAYDQGCDECQQAVTKILDGKDTGAGTANAPWELLRRRLLALVAQSAPQAQQAAREYPPLPPTLKCKPNEYCLAQHHVSLFTANQMRAYVDADRAAAQVEPVRMLTEDELHECCGGCTSNAAIKTWMRRAVADFCLVNRGRVIPTDVGVRS